MKKVLFLIGVVLAGILGSCSTARIPSSVWFSVTPFSINGENGYNVTSLHFLDKDQVVINGAAVDGDTLLAPAQLIATGTYKLDKKLKDGYTMSLNAETVFNDSIHFCLARLLRKMESPLGWAALSGLFGLGFGALCALTYWAAGGWAAALSWWLSGIPWDLLHGVANFAIALALFNPLRGLLTRLRDQYGFKM